MYTRIISYPIFIFIVIFCISACTEDSPVSPTNSEIIENQITALFDSVLENTHVPGIVAGIWAPNEGIELIYTGGVSDLATKTELEPSMVFRIGSNTKTMTITILLKLVEDGIISLDDKLSMYVPDYPRADEVTIEMLSNMRSGIFNYTESGDFWGIISQNPAKIWSFDDLISFSLTQEYYFEPGSSFYYSNTNTILIAKIIEQLTNKSLEAHITEKLISPLNLISTKYIPHGTQLPGIHSKGYYAGEYDPTFPECSELVDVSFGGPAGSAVSTIFELKKYVIALTEGAFLSEQMQSKRLNSMMNIGSPIGIEYGIGLFEYKSFFGHDGGIPGYTSLMVHSPTKNCTIIIWYNSQLPDTPTNLLGIITKLIYSEL